MLKNYLAIAIRIFLKQKTYSLINILGLSIGLASSLLISIYILDELSYDKYITDAHRIYRAGITEKFQGEEISYTDTPAPVDRGIDGSFSSSHLLLCFFLVEQLSSKN